MKYIDAEKLKSQIREWYNTYKLGQHSPYRNGKAEALRETIELIDSLQQPIGEEYTIEVGKHTHTLRVGSQSDIDNLIRQEKQEQPEMELEKLALEKYPVEMVFRDPFDERNCDDGEEDINEYKRDAYLQGLKAGYKLGLKRKEE